MTPLSPPAVTPGRTDFPVLLSVPHAGRDYPPWLVAMARGGQSSLTALEDPFVDRLVWRAMQDGFGAVIARTPRAAIDCNRGEDEVDPAIVEGFGQGRVTARARGGLGIIPGRTHRHGHLWRHPVSRGQLESRLSDAHRPYHQAIEDALAGIRDRFGCALLIDCHSMPPARAVPPIVFGDCRGRSADPWVAEHAAAIARRHGFDSGLNDPYAGGHVLERHGKPATGVHALQVEIDRTCYLGADLVTPSDGFDRVARLIQALATGLGEALLARQFATAAE